MKSMLTVGLFAIALGGCAAGFPTPPLETVEAGPYERDAAIIEHGLIRENRRPYLCDVQSDSAILCQGVDRKVN